MATKRTKKRATKKQTVKKTRKELQKEKREKERKKLLAANERIMKEMKKSYSGGIPDEEELNASHNLIKDICGHCLGFDVETESFLMLPTVQVLEMFNREYVYWASTCEECRWCSSGEFLRCMAIPPGRKINNEEDSQHCPNFEEA